MSRKFRDWRLDQNYLFPPSPQDWLPQNHLVYFLLDVSEQIDMAPIFADYESELVSHLPCRPKQLRSRSRLLGCNS